MRAPLTVAPSRVGSAQAAGLAAASHLCPPVPSSGSLLMQRRFMGHEAATGTGGGAGTEAAGGVCPPSGLQPAWCRRLKETSAGR